MGRFLSHPTQCFEKSMVFKMTDFCRFICMRSATVNICLSKSDEWRQRQMWDSMNANDLFLNGSGSLGKWSLLKHKKSNHEMFHNFLSFWSLRHKSIKKRWLFNFFIPRAPNMMSILWATPFSKMHVLYKKNLWTVIINKWYYKWYYKYNILLVEMKL